MKSKSELSSATEYKSWLLGLKQRFRQAQLKAAVSVKEACQQVLALFAELRDWL